eukprot:1147439-Pelagomonas_calceolata.AAC.1
MYGQCFCGIEKRGRLRTVCPAVSALDGLLRERALVQAFNRAKLAGLHEAITPAPTSFASELQGLLARKTMLENKYASKKIKYSFSRALPTPIHAALKKWAL